MTFFLDRTSEKQPEVAFFKPLIDEEENVTKKLDEPLNESNVKPWRENMKKPSKDHFKPEEKSTDFLNASKTKHPEEKPWRSNMRNPSKELFTNEQVENSEKNPPSPLTKPWRANMKRKSEEDAINNGTTYTSLVYIYIHYTGVEKKLSIPGPV